MGLAEDLVTTDEFKKLINRLNTVTLLQIIKDRDKAEAYARKAVEEHDCDNLNQEHIDFVVAEMQQIAKLILEDRGQKESKKT